MDTKRETQKRSGVESREEHLKCWIISENPQCMRIETFDGTQYLIPYGYFECAVYRKKEDGESLNIQCKDIKFSINGRGLDNLLAAMQKLTVESLRQCPTRYQALTKEAIVTRIEVLARTADEPDGNL